MKELDKLDKYDSVISKLNHKLHNLMGKYCYNIYYEFADNELGEFDYIDLFKIKL